MTLSLRSALKQSPIGGICCNLGLQFGRIDLMIQTRLGSPGRSGCGRLIEPRQSPLAFLKEGVSNPCLPRQSGFLAEQGFPLFLAIIAHRASTHFKGKRRDFMAVKYRDYYEILGIQRSVGQDEIQRAYRKLARKYHPDVSKAANAEDKFKELSEAYEVLKDPEKRKMYDQFGPNWRSGQDFRPPPEWGAQFDTAGAGPGRPSFNGAGPAGSAIFSRRFWRQGFSAERGGAIRTWRGMAPGGCRPGNHVTDNPGGGLSRRDQAYTSPEPGHKPEWPDGSPGEAL